MFKLVVVEVVGEVVVGEVEVVEVVEVVAGAWTKCSTDERMRLQLDSCRVFNTAQGSSRATTVSRVHR